MSKRITAEVNDVRNTGESADASVELPPPLGPAEGAPMWEDRPVLHEEPERDPRSIPAHEDVVPSRRTGAR